MLYIFDGDNDFARREAVAALKARLGPTDMVSLNTTVFEGGKVGFDELRHACDSMPFLNDARLVIVDGLLTRLQSQPRKKSDSPEEQADADTSSESRNGASKAFRDRLLDYLPTLPSTAHLVLLEPALLAAGSAFGKWIASHPDKVTRKACLLPNLRRAEGQAELEKWITDRAKTKGATIDRKAASALVTLIGNDLQQMDSDLEKLAVYCKDRPITTDDVKELISLAREAVVWDLVDAIAQKNLKVAMDTLRRLLEEGEPPLRIFGLIVREYRLLVQIKDMANRGFPDERILAALSLQPWMLRQRAAAISQTRLDRLKSVYRTLLHTDVEMKTGVQEPESALEFLVAQLCKG